jgi:glycerate dehydrogenase
MSKKPRAVFLERAAFNIKINPVDLSSICDWVEYETTTAEQVAERLSGATAALVVGLPVGPAMLDGVDGLKLLSVCSTGIDHIDIDYCKSRGIEVQGVRSYGTRAVAEHAMALLLSLKRNLPAFQADVRAGKWQNSEEYCLTTYPVEDLDGLRLGLIGAGEIGNAFAKMAEAFGMEVVRAERKGAETVRDGYTDFETVLRSCDVISLHCPLTPDNQGMLGAAEFAQMERCPVLINTARGALTDEAALVDAIRSGQIRAAGLDVASSEPIAPHNPLLSFVDDHRLLLTPHMAWSSRQAQQRLYELGVRNIENFLRAKQ